jgi:hypothetical protein
MTSPNNKPTRPWARMSLRVMVLIVLIVAVLMSWHVNTAREQREAIDAVREYGGSVHFDYEFVGDNLIPGQTPWGPRWLRDILGDEYFRSVRQVSLDYDDSTGKLINNRNVKACDDLLKKIFKLPGLNKLHMKKTQATDEGLRHIGRMSNLEELHIWYARSVTDAGVSHLARLRNLKRVDINFSSLTDDSLAMLSNLPRMQVIGLQGNDFSGAALARVNGKHSLKELWIGGGTVRITDAGLVHLRDFKKLEVLDLQQSRVTSVGLKELSRLPSLKNLLLIGTTVTKAEVRRALEARRN